MWTMNRGEVWWVDFEPSVGGEIRKKRPAIILSNDTANRFLNRVQVVPLTSNIRKLYPGEAYVTVAGKRGKAQGNQLATVSKQRISGRLAIISLSELKDVEMAVKIQLGLD